MINKHETKQIIEIATQLANNMVGNNLTSCETSIAAQDRHAKTLRVEIRMERESTPAVLELGDPEPAF